MENYSTPDLSSGRLTYTRARMEDAAAMFNGWGGNPKVARYMMFRPMSLEECEQHIAGVIEAYEAGGNQDHWIIRKDGVYYDAAGYAILRREYEKGGDKHGE